MSQTAVTITADEGFAGMAADSGSKDILSRSLQSGTAEFGRAVVEGTDQGEFALPSGASFEMLGVTLFNHTNRTDSLTSTDGVDAGQVTDILQKGRIWVLPEEAVVRTDPVFVRHTTNGGDTPGGFRQDADTANAEEVSSLQWLSDGDASTPAILGVNLP